MKPNFVMVDFENVQPSNMGLLRGGPFRIKVFLGASQGKISLEMAQALQTFGDDAEYIQVVGNAKDALDFHIAYYIGKLSVENPGASFSIISRDTGFDPLIKHLKAKGIECKRSASIADIPHIKSATLSPVVKAAKAKTPKPGGAKAGSVKADGAKPGGTKPADVKPGGTRTGASKPGGTRTGPAKPTAEAVAAPGVLRTAPVKGRLEVVLENLSRRRQGLPATLKTLRSTIASLFKPALGDAELDSLLAELTGRGKIIVTGTKVRYELG
jgi:hypothetical protein